MEKKEKEKTDLVTTQQKKHITNSWTYNAVMRRKSLLGKENKNNLSVGVCSIWTKEYVYKKIQTNSKEYCVRNSQTQHDKM